MNSKTIFVIGLIATLAIFATTPAFTATVFADDGDTNGGQDNDQTCSTASRCQAINQENDEGDNTVGDVRFG